MKCKGHNFFFHIYTFLDSDFSILIENRNNFQCQYVCVKSSGKLTCLKPPEISIMIIFLKKYPVATLFVSFFFLLMGTNIIIPYSFSVCKTVGMVDIGHHFERFTVATATWLTAMEYLCHKWLRICFTSRKHFPVLSSFMTYLSLLIITKNRLLKYTIMKE